MTDKMNESYDEFQKRLDEKIHNERMIRTVSQEDYLRFKIQESLIRCKYELEILKMYKLELVFWKSEYHNELIQGFKDVLEEIEILGET